MGFEHAWSKRQRVSGWKPHEVDASKVTGAMDSVASSMGGNESHAAGRKVCASSAFFLGECCERARVR
jgi:hypothetical protein